MLSITRISRSSSKRLRRCRPPTRSRTPSQSSQPTRVLQRHIGDPGAHGRQLLCKPGPNTVQNSESLSMTPKLKHVLTLKASVLFWSWSRLDIRTESNSLFLGHPATSSLFTLSFSWKLLCAYRLIALSPGAAHIPEYLHR